MKASARGSLSSAAVLAVLSAALATAAVLLGMLLRYGGSAQAERAAAEPQRTVVIDAGHGGADGGCVSVKVGASSEGEEGRYVLEKDCNLAISKVIAALFEVSGYNAVMTRETDIMLDGEGLGGSAKMRDLKARLDIASRYPDAIFISIHCNKFPSAECKGLQVYYSKNNEGSEDIARSVQESAVALLQSDNHRSIKAADSSIYILDRARQPAVLVECGFLSNPEEALLLSNEKHQKKLALAIVLPLL